MPPRYGVHACSALRVQVHCVEYTVQLPSRCEYPPATHTLYSTHTASSLVTYTVRIRYPRGAHAGPRGWWHAWCVHSAYGVTYACIVLMVPWNGVLIPPQPNRCLEGTSDVT